MINIRRMGCDYHHDPNFVIEREHGYDSYLALYLHSKSQIKYNSELIFCESGTFVIFDKNSPHYYGAYEEEYIEDWIQFECDESCIRGFNIPLGKPIHINCDIDVAGYFRMICNAYFRCLNDCAVTDNLMQAMFLDISALVNEKKDIPHYGELIRLRQEVYRYPQKEWTVKSMADIIHISEPYLQELYKAAFGISCMSDVINCRIKYAKSLLSSDLTVEEVSLRCGYNSTVHFSRQFKKNVGVSPLVWKKDNKMKCV